ncbi:MAG: hypothetical protein HRT36_07945 [Alphaproteobacteria bacterium]|nr:hypothetical protein [Alphaproteobacteria bacterium]
MHVGRGTVASEHKARSPEHFHPDLWLQEPYDRRFDFIRSCAVTDAARHDGSLLPEFITRHNTGSEA